MDGRVRLLLFPSCCWNMGSSRCTCGQIERQLTDRKDEIEREREEPTPVVKVIEDPGLWSTGGRAMARGTGNSPRPLTPGLFSFSKSTLSGPARVVGALGREGGPGPISPHGDRRGAHPCRQGRGVGRLVTE